MDRPSLTIVMPAWNEAAGIMDAVDECTDCLDRLVSTGLISAGAVIVVDDGSTDGTAEILDRIGESNPTVAAIHHAANSGLGAALRSGFGAATTDLVFYTDSDLPIDLGAIGTALELLDPETDAVSAFRSSRRGEGPRRFTYSIIYNLLCRVVLGTRVRDVNFAAKLMRTDQLHLLGLRSDGSFIDAEILGKLTRSGASIRQFSAEYRPRSRGVSTLSSLAVIGRTVKEMAALTPSIRRGGFVVPHRSTQ